MMDLYIYNADLSLTGVLDRFTSLMWIRRYFTAGAFELVVPATKGNVALLQKHRLIVRTDREDVGLINTIGISADNDGTELLTVSGSFMAGTLSRRVLYDTVQTDTLLTLIDRNIAVNCTDNNRRIPYLSVDKSIDVPSEYNFGLKYKNLAEYAEAVCRYNNIGLVVEFIHAAVNGLKLRARRGIDRSIEQVVNPQVVFCSDYGSIVNYSYDYSDEGASTTIYGYTIVSEDTYGGSTAPTYTNGTDKADYDRLESSAGVDAKTYSADVQVFKGYSSTGEPMYETESRKFVDNTATLAAIKTECANALAPVTDSMTGAVSYACGYLSKWDLGDVVTVKNDKWGLTLSQLITEITEYYDAATQTVEPVFGSPQKTLSELLKQK